MGSVKFNSPIGIELDMTYRRGLLIADSGNHAVRFVPIVSALF